ncbi:MAG: PH domain-containing protein [Gammaproteobacteria bacterium]
MEVFAISPASVRPLWFIWLIAVLLILILLALAYTAYSSRHSRVEVESDRIRLVGDFWGREIPFTLLDVSAARILDLNGHSQYMPKRRTLGTGLPGYAAGWFRLHNGEKALLYLTSRDNVVYVPSTEGYSLLLSIEDAEKFIATLARLSHPGVRKAG